MPIATREAEITWEGSLASGTGTVSGGSGALGRLPVTWASRTERPDGKTSPEELIAAAHASCFSMALALVLGENDTPPQRLTSAQSQTRCAGMSRSASKASLRGTERSAQGVSALTSSPAGCTSRMRATVCPA